jgi:hypothetical protein
VDWKGSPLLLVEEGKPPYPKNDTSTDARIAWLNTPPKGHHLIHWDGLSQRTLKFEKSTGLFTFHVQPFGEGWLLCEARGGRADVYDGAGQPRRTFDLGDASNDVQTTPDGHIWVSYFDEGVFGHGLGSHGVVCFDSKEFTLVHSLGCYSCDRTGLQLQTKNELLVFRYSQGFVRREDLCLFKQGNQYPT